MLISTNKKNNIAKSIALMLALVLAFSCILTACADKTARKDVEDLKATVDALGKDVDTVEGVANSAVTNDALTQALANALADYLTKEGHEADIAALLAEYTKTNDAKAFLEEALGAYYTKAEIDEMMKGYFTKAEVETLVENFVTAEDIPGFIAAYLGTPEAKDAIVELLDDTYMDLGDWDAATAEVLTAIANVSKAIGALDNDIFTVEDYAKYVELVETAFDVYIDEDNFDYEQLIIDILRATEPSEFDYIEKLVEDTAALDAASEAIKAINDKIVALQTASEGKIDTDDKAALDEIKAAIVAFDAKYGFNATLITVDVATADFYLAFCGTAMGQADIDAKLVVNNNYTSNVDYVTNGGLKISEYIAMQERYDFLMAWAADIDVMIVGLVAEIGEEQSISDAQLALIRDVMDEVLGDSTAADGTDAKAGFVAANNGITTPIKGWNTYLYYEWLAGKRIYDDNKIEAKADLDAYAALNATKFDSAAMNKDVAQIVNRAKDVIDGKIVADELVEGKEPNFNYATYKSYSEAKAALDAYILTIKKDIDEVLYTYCLADTTLKAIEAIEAKKAALDAANADGKYDSVIALADTFIAAINAVEVAEKSETVPYPYTAAYNAVVDLKNDGITAIDLAKAKIDAKLEVLAYAKDYLNGGANAIFDGTEKNYNDIEAAVIADAKSTYASIDAVEVITGIDAAKAAAKVVVDESAYTEKLNVVKSNVQATILDTAKAAKVYADANPTAGVDYTAIGALATGKYVVEIFDIAMAYDANDATKDTWAEAFATAQAAVVAKGEAFNAETVVAAYLALIVNP